MKRVLVGGVLAGLVCLVQAQNYNNGEDLAKFVTSEQFGSMGVGELKPIRDKVAVHLNRCVAATVKQLQTQPNKTGVGAAQLQRHYQVWQPYYKSACQLYAADQGGDAAEAAASQLRCEVFSQSMFYSEVLGYQQQPLAVCQQP